MHNPDPYSFIETYSGKRYIFTRPTPDMICKEDIAHALSRICRFTGHVKDFYSVASHSLLVASLVPEEFKLQALLHDATEAYVGDVSSPLKRLLGGHYEDMETNARMAITEHFGVDFDMPPVIKLADRHALYLEAKYLFNRRTKEFPEVWSHFKQAGMPDINPKLYWDDISLVEQFFLAVLERYTKCETSSCA